MNAPIKIVRIISRLNVGGPAQHAVYLSRYFSGMGWQSHLLGGMEDESEKNMMYLVEKEKIAFQRVSMMRRSLHLFRDLAAFWQIFWILRRLKPDIVHTHTAKAGALGRMAAFCAGVSVKVHTFHGHVFEGYFGRFWTWVFVATERFLGRGTDCLVTLTEKLKQELLARGIQGQKGIRIVPLGLNLEKFKRFDKKGEFRKSLNLDSNSKLIGIIGRLVPVKRHCDLIQAMKILVDKGFPVHLAVIGGGELENDLHAQVENLGLGERVHFCGFREDVEHIYPDLDLVALSSANEGMPVCLIEAMVCGIPIVSTNVGGVDDLLSDCPSCRTVPPYRSQDLAEAIENVMENLEEIVRKAAEHRETSFARFGGDLLGDRLKNLYLELLEDV